MGYLTIEEAMKPEKEGCFFNLCCVIAEIGEHYKCLGTDFTCTLRVMDPSYTNFGMPTTFFASHLHLLPHVRSTSDIAIFHNLQIKRRTDGHNLFLVYQKKYSSFALFAQDIPCDKPYHCSSRYNETNLDLLHAEQTRKWLQTAPPLAGFKSLERQINDITAGCCVDLVVEVVHASEEVDRWYLFVWDGTDPPLIEIPLESTDVLQALPPTYVPTRPIGTVLLVTSQISFKEFKHLVGTEKHWVRLSNVFVERHGGMWHGILQCNSMIRLLSCRDAGVIERIRKCNSQLPPDLQYAV